LAEAAVDHRESKHLADVARQSGLSDTMRTPEEDADGSGKDGKNDEQLLDFHV